MKHLFVILICTFIVTTATAQNSTANSSSYKSAIGIKIWDGAGATLKTFLDERSALEFIGFFWRNGTRITGLYEYHGNLNTEGNVKWYLGFGGHASLYKNGTGGGIDGVAGIDFKLAKSPINIAIDWQPSIEIGVGSLNGFAGSYGGLAVRYTF
jgi:hypothetical protein